MKTTLVLGLLVCCMFGAALLGGCSSNSTGPSGPVPITANLFPVVAFHTYIYTGYLIDTSGNAVPDTGHVYNSIWTVLIGIAPVPPRVAGDAVFFIHDSTTFPTPGGPMAGSSILPLDKSSSGDFSLLETLDAFFASTGVPSAGHKDTVWISIARPSKGLGGSWTAWDSTYTNVLGSHVRLQILGTVGANVVTITDSSAGHATHQCYVFRTTRTITIDGTVVSSAETAEFWLEPDVGPIQARIDPQPGSTGSFNVFVQKTF